MELICRERSSGAACGNCSSCKRINILQHPDLLYIKPKKNGTIKIDEIREAKEKLRLKPYEALLSVCLIEDAHRMTEQASNALLKLLEEPPGESMLILVSDKKENLLPTVLSRCTEVRFRPLPVKTARDIIMKVSGVSEEEALFLAYFSQGSPGLAIEMIRNEVFRNRQSSTEKLEEILFGGDLSCVCWDSEKKDDLVEAVDLLVMMLRDIVMAREGCQEKMLRPDTVKSGIYAFLGGYSYDRLHDILDKLSRLKSALLGSVNPRLVAQVLPGCLEDFDF
jgi:DNA polymerase-3 subunit delta'